jgi:hypothetical protein
MAAMQTGEGPLQRPIQCRASNLLNYFCPSLNAALLEHFASPFCCGLRPWLDLTMHFSYKSITSIHSGSSPMIENRARPTCSGDYRSSDNKSMDDSDNCIDGKIRPTVMILQVTRAVVNSPRTFSGCTSTRY